MELSVKIYWHVCAVGAALWFLTIIRSGNIFSFYGDWLTRLHDGANPFLSKLAEPLGRCDTCFMTWIALGLGGYIGIVERNYWQPILSIGFCYLCLRYARAYFVFLDPWITVTHGVPASEDEAPVIPDVVAETDAPVAHA